VVVFAAGGILLFGSSIFVVFETGAVVLDCVVVVVAV
jgi:hypothetical protein